MGISLYYFVNSSMGFNVCLCVVRSLQIKNNYWEGMIIRGITLSKATIIIHANDLHNVHIIIRVPPKGGTRALPPPPPLFSVL